MKWQSLIVFALATLASARPMPQNDDDFVNDAANNGEGGIAAAAGAEAAVLLSENGAAGAVDEGEDFEDAVQAIVDSGNEDDVETLELAGIDVDAVVDGADDNNDDDNADDDNGGFGFFG